MRDDRLGQTLLSLLQRHPEGLSEHALLKLLQASDETAFPKGRIEGDMALFRMHFLLFHALYRLRDRLLAEGMGSLHIDVLKIQLGEIEKGVAGNSIAHHDPMRDYYLDLNNMTQTTAEELEQMLGAFWTRYFADERRPHALAVLGLSDPVDNDMIRERYRRLAMQHHPDRGGDPARFIELREAMAVLKRCDPTP